MKAFYVHHNGGSWFVKAASFFCQQNGHKEAWGEGWSRIEAESFYDAKEKAQALWPGGEGAPGRDGGQAPKPHPWSDVEPSTEDNGLPPVGTDQDGPYVLTAEIHPKPAVWEIVAHRGHEAIVYCNRKGEGQAEVFLIPAEEFRDKETESMRKELEQFFAERWSHTQSTAHTSTHAGGYLAASVMSNYDIRRKEK